MDLKEDGEVRQPGRYPRQKRAVLLDPNQPPSAERRIMSPIEDDLTQDAEVRPIGVSLDHAIVRANRTLPFSLIFAEPPLCGNNQCAAYTILNKP